MWKNLKGKGEVLSSYLQIKAFGKNIKRGHENLWK